MKDFQKPFAEFYLHSGNIKLNDEISIYCFEIDLKFNVILRTRLNKLDKC